jgi:hypothetical protein
MLKKLSILMPPRLDAQGGCPVRPGLRPALILVKQLTERQVLERMALVINSFKNQIEELTTTICVIIRVLQPRDGSQQDFNFWVIVN